MADAVALSTVGAVVGSEIVIGGKDLLEGDAHAGSPGRCFMMGELAVS